MFYQWIILVCILDFMSLPFHKIWNIQDYVFSGYCIMWLDNIEQDGTGDILAVDPLLVTQQNLLAVSVFLHWSLVCCLFSTFRFVALLILLPVCFMLIYKFIWFCANIVFYFQNWCGWAIVYSFMHLSFITYYIFFFLSSGLLLIKPSMTSVGGIGLLIDVSSNGLREFSSKLIWR